MGITVKRLLFKEHRKSEKLAEIDFLIDSGAVYSLVPGKIMDDLGIETYRTIDFSLVVENMDMYPDAFYLGLINKTFEEYAGF